MASKLQVMWRSRNWAKFVLVGIKSKLSWYYYFGAFQLGFTRIEQSRFRKHISEIIVHLEQLITMVSKH